MLSQSSEYALRAAVLLALRCENPSTAQQIAADTQVPIDYLFKILNQLSRAGLVSGQRGKGGGYLLTREPERITILEVVNAIDPLRRITHCPLGIKGHTRLCPLHRRVDEAIATIESAFGGTTLAELVEEKTGPLPLCAPGTSKKGLVHVALA